MMDDNNTGARTPRSSETTARHVATRDFGPSALMADSRISRGASILAAVFFAALVVTPAIQEILSPSRATLLSSFKTDAATYGVQVALQEVEKHFIYDSQFATTVRQPYQRFLIARLGQGSRSVLVGENGVLFHRNDAASLAGPGILSDAFSKPPEAGMDVTEDLVNRLLRRWRAPVPGRRSVAAAEPFADSVTVLSDFDAQLRERGVHLVAVVVPGKSTIYPDLLWPGYPGSAGPALNADYAEWKRRLVGRGVDLVDLSDAFWRARHDDGDLLFLRQDTHWSPRGVSLGAEVVAERVRAVLGEYSTSGRTVERVRVAEPTDLLDLMGLHPEADAAPGRTTELTQVLPDRTGAEEVSLAPILLFGDSLSGYYDPQRAGFAQQLMLQLNTGVERVIGFGAGLPGAIQNAFAADRGLLKDKRIVVLEFHMSQLYLKTFSTRLALP